MTIKTNSILKLDRKVTNCDVQLSNDGVAFDAEVAPPSEKQARGRNLHEKEGRGFREGGGGIHIQKKTLAGLRVEEVDRVLRTQTGVL